MRRWADGNDAVWEAAQHVSGWGRIHAVAQLEPGSDAIRRWLLLEGWRNNVAPDYSALTCVENPAWRKPCTAAPCTAPNSPLQENCFLIC